MKERKQKTITYKQVRFHTPGPHLKNLLVTALKKFSKVGERREGLSPDNESQIWQVIGEFSIEKEFVFGVLMRYAPGTNPAFVVDDADLQTLTVEQMAAPMTDKGKRRELVDSMLYFGAIDNHVVMMQTTGLRSDNLEGHLQWLLHSSNALKGDNSLQLIDQPPKTIRDRLESAKVRELDIGGVLLPVGKTHKPEEEKRQERHSKADSMTVNSSATSEGVVSALKNLMGRSAAARLDMDAFLGSNIEYTLQIRYRHNTTSDGQKLMDTIGSALRHAEGVQTTVHLVGGGEIKGEEMRLTGRAYIDAYDGIPVATEVFEVMRSWLLQKLRSGELSA